ncbi:MAG: hypothetical protein JSR67_08070 [Proteobacteria bacterium]|nr:hypothetical protein [Pseudomonadota bacterium]
MRIALVSARAALGVDEDLPPLAAAFAQAGAGCEITIWDDPDCDWSRFDAALLRSAWDYAERVQEFLAWVERAAAQTLLLNPPPVVRWNSDKHYLRDLAAAGAATVPTRFVEPADSAPRALEQFLAAHPGASELVVKPAVGAGARGARRHARSARQETLGHVSALLDAGRSVMLQPYLASVDRDGETALMYIDGQFSHAIRKGPLLTAGAASTAGLFAAEDITRREPGADELALARQALAAVPGAPLLYGRVDLVRDAGDRPCVLELELCEPSLYFSYASGAAQRLAAATLKRLAYTTPTHLQAAQP